MFSRFVSVAFAGLALAIVANAPIGAGEKGAKDDKNTHIGTLVSVKGNTFTMEVAGKEHAHTLAPTAKVTGPDGAEAKLSSLTKGTAIRVTTKEGDSAVATRVEVMRKSD
jgi:hypothetical protein